VAYFKHLYWPFWRDWWELRSPTIRIAGVWTDIVTRDLNIAKHECYHYTTSSSHGERKRRIEPRSWADPVVWQNVTITSAHTVVCWRDNIWNEINKLNVYWEMGGVFSRDLRDVTHRQVCVGIPT
jgi:hypothetical protein